MSVRGIGIENLLAGTPIANCDPRMTTAKLVRAQACARVGPLYPVTHPISLTIILKGAALFPRPFQVPVRRS
jgi:hypothetical protein